MPACIFRKRRRLQEWLPVWVNIFPDNSFRPDTIASVLAVALSKHFDVRLIFCFEKKGVLMNVNDLGSVIRHLPQTKYNDLLPKGVFADGILPKLENAYAAIGAGVKEVLIGEAVDLLKNTGQETEGTLITL